MVRVGESMSFDEVEDLSGPNGRKRKGAPAAAPAPEAAAPIPMPAQAAPAPMWRKRRKEEAIPEVLPEVAPPTEVTEADETEAAKGDDSSSLF